MDTNTAATPTAPEPVPARAGREGPSRRRTLATSLAAAGLTATGGLAVILSVAATSGSGAAADTVAGAPGRQAPSAPRASANPNAITAPATVQGGTQTAPQGTSTPAQLGGQPPQSGQGGPGHASSGGS
jgi:hypothetical protein